MQTEEKKVTRSCLADALCDTEEEKKAFLAQYKADPAPEKRLSHEQLMDMLSSNDPAPEDDIPIVSVDEIPEKKMKWIIPGFIPEERFTYISGDGGVGKSTCWANILAGLSSGKKTMLDDDSFTGRNKMIVAYLSAEDSTAKVVKKKLRACGAEMSNIRTIPDDRKILNKMIIGEKPFNKWIQKVKARILVIDPIQSFTPEGYDLCKKTDFRKIIGMILDACEPVGTIPIVVGHTNKRADASGRNRVADSADIWDGSSSLIMIGETGDGDIIYLSQEKGNYSKKKANTVLFKLVDTDIDDDGDGVAVVHVVDRTDKRDSYYCAIKRNRFNRRKNTTTDDCAEDIVGYLKEHEGIEESTELKRAIIKEYGDSEYSYNKAYKKLRNDGIIEVAHPDSKKGEKFKVKLKGFNEEPETE